MMQNCENIRNQIWSHILCVNTTHSHNVTLHYFILHCVCIHTHTVLPLKPRISDYGVHGLVSSPYCSMVTTGTYRQAGSVEYLRMLQG